jgi:signal transduction histidine kinase
VPDVKRPEMPLPLLIAALRASAATDAPGPAGTQEVGGALARVAERLGLAGLRLALLDEDPMRSLEAGSGTLGGDPGRDPDFVIRAAAGTPLAHLWVDGQPAARDEAAVSLEAAVLAARAHLSAERAREHLAALDAALRGISGSLDIEEVLQLIVDRVRSLADAEYAALGIVDEEGLIRRFMTSGIDPELRRHIGSLPRGHGLLGLLVREGRSIRIPDIAADPRRHGFPPHHPAMASFLGVPITVKGRSIGNLYLTNKRGHAAFSAADQELVERFALHAGIAIEQARLAQQVQQLVVIEERERIGADLHDGVIQRIYGVNLSLDEVPELVAARPDEAARRVEQAIEALNATIGEIREFIYILRAPGDAVGLGPSLRALAAEVRLQTGLPVEVVSDELPTMPGDQIRELLSIVREALSNAARHAGAERAEVAARRGAQGLRVTVSDDGIGFDAAADPGEHHHGLVNMRRRAAWLGGTLEVASRPGAGTRIIVTLPSELEQTEGGGFGRA